MVNYRSVPQKDHPCAETCRLSHKARKSVQQFDLGAVSRKGKDRREHSKTSKTQSSATVKSTARPSCLAGVHHDIFLGEKSLDG